MLEPTNQSRVLATIVFTDAVAFSARMGADEHRTVINIKRDLAYITQQCAAHDGRVIKNTGDGLLMQFGSAGRAIECAMAVQTTFAQDAESKPAEDCLQHRIGIHLGDVVISDSDVLGDGVNIAARILAQAEPGGICFSQTVYEVVKNRLAIKATFLGPRELKNIRESVPLYQILVAAAAQQTVGTAVTVPIGDILASPAISESIPGPWASRKNTRLAIVGIAAVAAMLVVGMIVFQSRRIERALGGAVANAATPSVGQANGAVEKGGSKDASANVGDLNRDSMPAVVPPVSEQIAALVAELKQRNPGFDGAITPLFDAERMVGLSFKVDRVSDLAPLSKLKHLSQLKLLGPSSMLSSLSPLKGLALTELTIDGNSGITDLTPLKGMRLTKLRADATRIADLAPLAGMPLENLSVWNWRGWDLEPLRKMPLKLLNVGGNGQAMDLGPLAGAPLDFLCINVSKVSDISALKGAPLKTFMCSNTLVADLSPLIGSSIEELIAQTCRVTDFSPLKDLPLASLKIDFKPERDAEVIRQIKTLRRINDEPAAQFLKSTEQK